MTGINIMVANTSHIHHQSARPPGYVLDYFSRKDVEAFSTLMRHAFSVAAQKSDNPENLDEEIIQAFIEAEEFVREKIGNQSTDATFFRKLQKFELVLAQAAGYGRRPIEQIMQESMFLGSLLPAKKAIYLENKSNPQAPIENT